MKVDSPGDTVCEFHVDGSKEELGGNASHCNYVLGLHLLDSGDEMSLGAIGDLDGIWVPVIGRMAHTDVGEPNAMTGDPVDVEMVSGFLAT